MILSVTTIHKSVGLPWYVMTTVQTQSTLLATVGDIAESLDVKEHRVRYAVATRHIQPVQRAGGIRLFGPGGVEQIREALQEIGPEQI